MPEPRPLASLRLGGYDEPAASSTTSDPATRRHRMRQVLESTRELDHDRSSAPATLPMPVSDARRSVYVAPSTRRRRRSDSVPESGGGSSPVSSTGAVVGDRRVKRRKLDTETSSVPKQAIQYGYYGKVEPGRLKMELVSCDGGEHRDPRHPATSLGPDNMLKHDKSVYCSERPHANILLRHADSSTFCLEKLHIIGPEHGFTAAVREGLVYVAMSIKDLEQYIGPPPHARLSGIHSPPYRRRRNRGLQASPERITLSDALRDPTIDAALNERELRYGHDADGLHDLARARHIYEDDFDLENTDQDNHCDIPSTDDNPSSRAHEDDLDHSNGRPTTLLSDEEPGPEDISSQDIIDYRLQRLRWARRRLENDRYDTDERWSGLSRLPPETIAARQSEAILNQQAQLLHESWARGERPGIPEPVFPQHEAPPTYPMHHLHPTADSRGAEEGMEDKNVTCARFHIRKNRNKVTIKFDPAVSGRFILLKLWANRSNVDVQSVIPMGFGQCRFFPAVAMR